MHGTELCITELPWSFTSCLPVLSDLRMRKAAEDKFANAAALEKQDAADPLEQFCKESPVSFDRSSSQLLDVWAVRTLRFEGPHA